ncbi:hypothetical protein RMATCC62417_09652 [Rhizopus microsporus]|nr:hypothetical protein RMATCC62417_09652 [Rhizopus microsporus]
MLAFLASRVWATDRFRCLHPKRIIHGELRSVITVIYFLVALMQMTWDVISTWIKYSEKFVQIPNTNMIISKPFDYWTPQHQYIAMSIDYLECVTLSMQTGIFFLLQCFWHYLSTNVAKKSFMGSWEFRFYIFWALGSVAVFPILQWTYRDDVIKREAIPQLAYSTEILIAALLGIRSHFRFNRIINIARNMKTGSTAVTEKMAYFKDMNLFITAVLFLYAFSLGTLCVDGLTEGMVINSNKFSADLLISIVDTCSILIWIVGICIFHPRRSTEEADISALSKSGTNQDVETNNGNRFGASFDNTNNNGSTSSRLSQRITHFIENRNSGRLQASRGFIRPMSPVEVDYPTTTTMAATLTEGNTGFSVLDPNSKRYNIQPSRTSFESSKQDFPMHTMSGAAAAAANRDFRFDPITEKDNDDYDYMVTPQDWPTQPMPNRQG